MLIYKSEFETQKEIYKFGLPTPPRFIKKYRFINNIEHINDLTLIRMLRF